MRTAVELESYVTERNNAESNNAESNNAEALNTGDNGPGRNVRGDLVGRVMLSRRCLEERDVAERRHQARLAQLHRRAGQADRALRRAVAETFGDKGEVGDVLWYRKKVRTFWTVTAEATVEGITGRCILQEAGVTILELPSGRDRVHLRSAGELADYLDSYNRKEVRAAS